MTKRQLISSLLLFLTAAIWGVAFVAQSEADSVGAFTFNCLRSLIGGTVLLPVIAAFGKKPSEQREERIRERRKLLLYGAICGTFLMIASSFQQIGINLGASTGKAGFITACYIIFVPIISIFFGKRTAPFIWAAVALAAIGLYLLCMTDSLKFEYSDILLFACAISFSLQILAIDRFSPKVDCIKLACVQFYTCGILSGIMMLIFEKPSIDGIINAWQPILYTGVMSSGVAYTLQIVAQKGLNPTVASLIMSLESAIAAVSGWLILGQTMQPREIVGCFVMFAAIILAQLPSGKRRSKERK